MKFQKYSAFDWSNLSPEKQKKLITQFLQQPLAQLIEQLILKYRPVEKIKQQQKKYFVPLQQYLIEDLKIYLVNQILERFEQFFPRYRHLFESPTNYEDFEAFQQEIITKKIPTLLTEKPFLKKLQWLIQELSRQLLKHPNLLKLQRTESNLRVLFKWISETEQFFDKNWEQALTEAQRWIQRKTKEHQPILPNEIVDYKFPPIIETPQKKVYYVMIDISNPTAMKKEGELMGHCVGEGFNIEDLKYGTKFYSLRKIEEKATTFKVESKATLRIFENQKLFEAKGPRNEPVTKDPDRKYILEWLEQRQITPETSALIDYIPLVENHEQLLEYVIKEITGLIAKHHTSEDKYEREDIQYEVENTLDTLKEQKIDLTKLPPKFITELLRFNQKLSLILAPEINFEEINKKLINAQLDNFLYLSDAGKAYYNDYFQDLLFEKIKEGEKINSYLLKKLGKNLRKEILAEVINTFPKILENLSTEELEQYQQYLPEYIKNLSEFEDIPKELKQFIVEKITDPELLKTVLKSDSTFYTYLPENLKNNTEFVTIYLKKSPTFFDLDRSTLLAHLNFIFQLIKHTKFSTIKLEELLGPFEVHEKGKKDFQLPENVKEQLLKNYLKAKPEGLKHIQKKYLQQFIIDQTIYISEIMKQYQENPQKTVWKLDNIPSKLITENLIEQILKITFKDTKISKELSEEFRKKIRNYRFYRELIVTATHQIKQLQQARDQELIRIEDESFRQRPWVLEDLERDLAQKIEYRKDLEEKLSKFETITQANIELPFLKELFRILPKKYTYLLEERLKKEYQKQLAASK